MNNKTRFAIVSILVCLAVLLQSCISAWPSAQPLALNKLEPVAQPVLGEAAKAAPAALTTPLPSANAKADGQPIPKQGRLAWPVELDADGDDTSNPLPGRSVPVFRIGSPELDEVTKYGLIQLGAEVLPDSPNINPAGTPVIFRIWSDDKTLDVSLPALADEWGAATGSLPVAAEQLGSKIHVSAQAGRFGNLPERTFWFDQNRFATDTQLGLVRSEISVNTEAK
ncbi:MAG: hypothetical protein HC853_03465 [Anaerolineae bacterium]|nr:hypothetical protein [Anaerolineae bacterium]